MTLRGETLGISQEVEVIAERVGVDVIVVVIPSEV
jgi:hypothetical protein